MYQLLNFVLESRPTQRIKFGNLMAYFKPRRNEQGFTEERRLPSAPEGSSMGHASLYDAFVGSLWKKTMDEYHRKGVGFGEGDVRERTSYPDKEVWWEDPRSR